MAFTMAFFLTPRVWVESTQTTSSEEIPVNALEEPNSCLWCDEPSAVPGNCPEESDETLWLNPDSTQKFHGDCDDQGTGPNA